MQERGNAVLLLTCERQSAANQKRRPELRHIIMEGQWIERRFQFDSVFESSCIGKQLENSIRRLPGEPINDNHSEVRTNMMAGRCCEPTGDVKVADAVSNYN
jgi:hypothetical protein